jgi:hypothetical protein
MYDNSPRECNITVPLNKERLDALSNISKLLISLRQQIVPYPNEYFHGRGIVLTVGQNQLGLAKVNLKMIELSGTRLPVQVNIVVFLYTQKRSFFLLKKVKNKKYIFINLLLFLLN